MSEPIILTGNFKNQCGHQVDTKMKFCPECGAAVVEPENEYEKYKRLEKELEKLKEENKSLTKTLEDLEI